MNFGRGILLGIMFSILFTGFLFSQDVFAAAPTADAGGPYIIDEGTLLTLDASGSADDGSIVSYEWDLDNDGTFGDATGITTDVLYTNEQLITIGLQITDDEALISTTTTTIQVDNVIPILTVIPGLTTIDEGDTFTGSGSFVDPGDDAFGGTVDYGDGTGVNPLTLNPDKTFDLSHTYVNNAPYTVTVTVNDGTDDGVDSILVNVVNVVPTIAPISDVTINEGDSIFVSSSFSDPGDDEWNGSVQLGDSEFEDLVLNPDKTFSFSHVYSNDGIFIAEVGVTEQLSGEEGETMNPEQFTVTVNNVLPILTLTPGIPIDEGNEFVTTGSFVDPGDEPWIITADYGDGTSPVNVGYETDKSFELSHVYENDGSFTITVTINDGSIPVVETIPVTVGNLPPTVDAGLDGSINEGDSFDSMGTYSDPGSDSVTLTIDYGDSTPAEIIPTNPDGTFDFSHVYENDGTFTITVTADDGSTNVFDTTYVVVSNVEPTVSVSDQLVDDNRLFTATGSFTDPGADTWTATIDYGDGSGSQPLTLNPDKTFALSHNYSTNGAFTTTVTVNDDVSAGVSSFTVGVFVSTSGPGAGLTSPPDVTATTNQGATFFTNDQDIWGPVTGGSGTSSWELFNPQSWDESDGDGDFATLDGSKFGGDINAGTLGHLKLTASASQLTGEIGVNYPGNMEIQYLDANTFLSGEKVPISGNWNLDTTGAKINAEKTMGDLRLDLDLAVNAFTNSEVCVFGCVDILDLDVGFDMHPGDTKLFSFTQAAGLDIPPALLGFAGLTGNFNPIMVQPSTTSVSGSTGTIVAETTTTFSDINIDMDKIATRLGVAPPLEKSVSGTGNSRLSYNIFDADANVDFKAHQKLTFDTGVLIKLDFIPPVDGVTGAVIDVTTDGAGKVTSATYRDGSNIEIIFPQDEINPILVTPTIFLESSKTTLNQFTEVITVSDVTMESMSSSLNIPGVTVVQAIPIYDPIPHFSNWHCHESVPVIGCIWGEYHHRWDYHQIGSTDPVVFGGVSFSIGPAWTSGPQGVETKKDTIANKAFNLGGFNTVQLASFELDPEVPPTAIIGGPYVVNEGSTILVDGSGSFDVDLPAQTLTHTWDLDNDATFETSGITADFVFGINGSTTHPISIQVCDYYNCDVDSGMVDVLNVAPTVDAGADATVDEGSLYSGSGSFTDPGADTWTATVDYGDGTGTSVLSLNVDKSFDLSHTYADNGQYIVTVTVTDDDHNTTFNGETVDGQGIGTLIVTVNNVNPSVDAGADQEAVIHDTVNLDPATYSDPGFDCGVCATLEDFTAIINWGEFSDEPLTVTEIPGSVGVLTEGTASGSHIFRLPGDYTVTVTVDDDDTGSTSDSLVTTVLGAQDLKNRANSFLIPYDAEKEVEKAIDAIDDSLDSGLWINDVYLDVKDGHKVFNEEKKAVKELQKLLKDNNLDPALEQAAQDSIDLLVNADRVLAITIMLDATSTPADDPKKQKKVDDENEKAADEFAEADQKRDNGDYDKAIDHYKKAWEHSQAALKHAAK